MQMGNWNSSHETDGPKKLSRDGSRSYTCAFRNAKLVDY